MCSDITKKSDNSAPRHLRMSEPADWVVRFQSLLPKKGQILDLAAGGGRHTRFLLEKGHRVLALDRNAEPLAGFADDINGEVIEADLEDGSPWPLGDRQFAGIIVCNYLHRPLMGALIDALAPGGVLLYETFALGNEAYNRPRNADHLLRAGELLDLFGERLQVVAYEHGVLEIGECPGVKQRICAVNNLTNSTRDDGEPEPLRLFP